MSQISLCSSSSEDRGIGAQGFENATPSIEPEAVPKEGQTHSGAPTSTSMIEEPPRFLW